MKKLITAVLILSLAAAFAVFPVSVGAEGTETVTYNYNLEGSMYNSSSNHTRQMEKLDRGLVAIKSGNSVYLSWRLFDSEDMVYGSSDKNVTFDVYRNGVKVNSEPVNVTNYTDTDAAASVTAKYAVVPSYAASGNSISANGETVTVNTAEDGFTAYAAKYNGGKLENVWANPAAVGTSTEALGFTPDRVFLWDGMKDVNNTGIEGDTPIALTDNNGSAYLDIPIKSGRVPQTMSLPRVVSHQTADQSKATNHFTSSTADEKQLTDADIIDDWRDENTVYTNYSYTINDCSTGDLDGDGEYEIVIKWDCAGQDNSNSGVTGNVYLDAYKLDGTPLWNAPIDLGKNIRAGAHYTQFLVYDLDGDGKAEISCKTAPGSKDSRGVYVSKASASSEINSVSNADNEKDYRNGSGYILEGPEYYTVFNGQTGAAIDTIEYPVPRGNLSLWGDTYGNRVDRYLGGIAYLDGIHPSIIAWRGYYARTTAAGITFENGRLKVGNKFIAESNRQYAGQGNHNLTVADVDNDGKDEIICGALALNDDLTPLWCSGRGHGDALHIGDYDPTHPGLEYFSVHESGGYTISGSTNGNDGKSADYGMTAYDAATGEELAHYGNNRDTGRGTMANIGSGGYYQITGAGTYQCNGGTNFTATSLSGGSNFRIFWDGDLFDEILDGTSISNLSDDGTSVRSVFSAGNDYVKINDTKANSSLQADILGDWREEVIYPSADSTSLRVFMSTAPTEYKIKTLMHDPVYRSGVAAEQTAYNQPPHVGFYMGSEMFDAPVSSIAITSEPSKKNYIIGETLDLTGLKVTATLENGMTKEVSSYSVSDFDNTSSGQKTITVTYMGKTASFTVNVKGVTKIEITSPPDDANVYQGGRLNTAGLVVTATYDDNTTAAVTDYTLEYDTKTLGSATATVKYFGCEAAFEINVLEADIGAINGDYVTNSTASTQEDIPIGEYRGNFTLEHKVTVNSMPANGSNSKDSTNGFFLRFMGTASGSTKAGTGGGWQIAASRNTTYIQWKSTSVQNIAAIQVGKTYTFKYDFVHVGDGTGASVTLTITDSDGKQVGSASSLNLRNFTNDAQKSSPITTIQVNNQAAANSTASVTISDAVITSE